MSFVGASWNQPTLTAEFTGLGVTRMLEAMREAEIYFGFGLPRPLFLAAKKLRWVQSASAGVASLLYPEMMASDVVITNSAVIMGGRSNEPRRARLRQRLAAFE